MTDYELLLSDMKKRLSNLEKVPYGEAIGAPPPYNTKGDPVWNDPEPYYIERAITAITDLLARAEAAEARLEMAHAELDAARKAQLENLVRAAKAEKQRDAAVRDISEIFGEVESTRLKYGIDDPRADDEFADVCHRYCSNCGPMCFKDGDGHKCENFKWRGEKEEK